MRFLLSLLMLVCAPAEADDFGKMAAKLTRAAARHGKKRVAVLAFQSIHSTNDPAGLIVAERLVSGVVEEGEIEVVERTLLESVMKEQQLEVSGVVDSESVKELGKILEVDALITGTVINLKNDRLEINARLIDAESAKVLTVTTARVNKEWSEPLGGFWNLTMPPLPTFEIAAPAWGGDWGGANDQQCDRLRRAVDQLEHSLVELKARYWSSRLKSRGFSVGALKRNPGSEIQNTETRSRFYARLRQLFEQSSDSRLSSEELRRLNEAQSEIERLQQRCQS